MTLKVAIVSRDAGVRDAAARAFSAAPGDWSVALCSEDPGDADVVVRGSDTGAAAGIVFDPARPQDALRAVTSARATGRTYVVLGAAGGVGVTTIALHLTARLGGRACCAELAGPSDRLALPPDALTWLPRDDDVGASALPVAGVRVLRAPLPCPAPDAFPLDAARSAFERLVLDAGVRRDVEGIVTAADAVVVVTSPTRPSALATRAVTRSLPDARWVVVVNRLGPGGQIMRGALEQLLGRPVAVELPCCPALRDAEDDGGLLAGTWRRWTRGVAALALALERC